jgi:hypothetical protein
VALFNYSDDEATLLIHGIGHAEYDLPDEDDEPFSFS